MVKKGSNQTNKSNSSEIEASSDEVNEGDNHTPKFSEVLSDGGMRNKRAEEQLKRLTTD